MPDTIDALERFLRARPDEKFRQLRDPDVAASVRAYLGEAAFDDLRALGSRRDASTLNVRIPPNVVFVPGVMGSLLSSRRGGIWWIDVRARKLLNELKLAADGKSDVKPEYGIRPAEVDMMYMPFLTAIDERPEFNFESFPYDWRKPLAESAGGLRDLVNRLYENNNREPVNIVAHSMGGLATRTALRLHGDEMWPKLNRIVFIATPHYGSTAIAGYLKNHFWGFELLSLLGLYLDRESFRSMTGVLGMLPAPRGIYPGTRADDTSPWQGGADDDPYRHPCANFDLYDASAWQLELDDAATAALQARLDAAREFHATLHAWHGSLKQSQRSRMAVIAGVGFDTLFRLEYDKRLWGLWESTDKVTARASGDRHREGDGRVPLPSATLENVGETRYFKGVHGEMPNIPAVYDDTFRWLKGEPMQLPETPAGALVGDLSGARGPRAAALARSSPVDAPAGDPGYWRLENDPAELDRLRQELEAEALPAFNRVRIL